jgi:monofunctional biosynthetic peptidoglycan transglycosylase
MTLFDFDDPAAATAFDSIDDVVMGGVSSSRLEPTGDGTALFSGTVSFENNGGFASVRSKPAAWDLSAAEGLALRVRGDGRRYKLNLRTAAMADQTAYQTEFETTGGRWQTVALPFERFEAKLRGRLQPDADPIDRSRVQTVGLMISDRQAGDFRLELGWIRTIPD